VDREKRHGGCADGPVPCDGDDRLVEGNERPIDPENSPALARSGTALRHVPMRRATVAAPKIAGPGGK